MRRSRRLLLVLGLMISEIGILAGTEEGCLISHQSDASFEEIYRTTKERLKVAPGLAVSHEDALWMLEQIKEFDLGRFILQHKGVNGYWTAYVILHGLETSLVNPLEEWIIRHSPVVLATQERFRIFKREVEIRIRSGMTIASIPCGTMDDLLLADKGSASDIKLWGIDLDQESLVLARENARIHSVEHDCDFLKRDAWNLEIDGQCDLITSNGLNIYEPDDERVTALYKNFYKALKPGGILIISFFTFPPTLDVNSPWRNYNVGDLQKQRGLFVDVCQVKWQVFRTEGQTREQLGAVGFKVLDVIYDHQSMFPTVVAERVN